MRRVTDRSEVLGLAIAAAALIEAAAGATAAAAPSAPVAPLAVTPLAASPLATPLLRWREPSRHGACPGRRRWLLAAVVLLQSIRVRIGEACVAVMARVL